MRWVALVYANVLALASLLAIDRDSLLLRTLGVVLPGAVGLAVYVWLGNRRRLHPGVDTLTSIGILVQFLLAPLYLVCVPLGGDLERGLLPYIDLFPEVGVAALAGQSMFLGGYAIATRAEGSRQGATIPVKSMGGVASLMRMMLPLLVGVWISRAVLLRTGSYYHLLPSAFMFDSPLYSIVAQISDFGSVMLAGGWLLAFSAAVTGRADYSRWRTIAVSLTVAELVWHVPSGSREPVLIVGLTVLICYAFVRQIIPKTAAAIAAGGLLVTVAFMDHYRYAVARVADPDSSGSVIVAEVLRESGERFAENDLGNGQWLTRSMSRLADGRSVAAIMSRVPDVVPYLEGESYARLLWVFVPRFLYPDKPSMIMPLRATLLESDEAGSSPTTLVGEAYLNFGWVGLFLVMPIVGAISRLYDRHFSRRLGDPAWAAVYLGMAVTVARLPVQPAAVWIGFFVKTALLAALISAWERTSAGFRAMR